MRAIDSIRLHPWRSLIAALLTLIVIVLIVGALIVRSLLQPQRFTKLLQNQISGIGLVLSVDKPAAPDLWPHPAVQLQGFRLSNTGASTPLLSASRARIVVPWRALLHGDLAIERLEIDTPRIDLDQLQALFARLPHGAGTPQLPRIEAGIRIDDGTLVRGDTPLLFGINATTGPLLPGQTFRLDASARDSADHAGALALRTEPVRENDALHFERIALGATIENNTRVQMAGDAVWHGGANFSATLQGKLTMPMATIPKASASTTAAKHSPAAPPGPQRSYTLALAIAPAQGANPLVVAVKLDGENQHIDAQIPPFALTDWWRRLVDAAPNAALTLPPLSGTAQIDDADFGPLHATGVRIDAGPDVAPLDAPSPATSAAKAADGKASASGH